MATTSPLQAVPLPDASDADDVPYNLGAAVDAMEKRLVMVYASATDRDSKVTAPAEGMVAYLQDANEWTAYDGTSWNRVPVLTSGDGLTLSALFIPAPTATTIPLTVKGAASQTANLQEWQDSTGAVRMAVTPAGRLSFPDNAFTTSAAPGSFSMPSLVGGFLTMTVGTSLVKVPFFF